MIFPSPACGRGEGEGKRVLRFHKRALTPTLSRKRERGNSALRFALIDAHLA